MKINKLRVLSIAIFCLVGALCLDIQCMDSKDGNEEKEKYNKYIGIYYQPKDLDVLSKSINEDMRILHRSIGFIDTLFSYKETSLRHSLKEADDQYYDNLIKSNINICKKRLQEMNTNTNESQRNKIRYMGQKISEFEKKL